MKNTIKIMAEVFKALGDPTRLKIIRLLSSRGNYLCVGALANKLNVTQPAVSQHLKVLKNVGIVEANRVGFHVHYTISKDVLIEYKTLIDEMLKKAFESCTYPGPCASCPESEVCEDKKE